MTIGGQDYYYDQGVYYQPSGSGYTAVAPPVGAGINRLPDGYESIFVGDEAYYYYGGAFYVSDNGSFRVIPAPVGAVITHLPEGAQEETINGQRYLRYNNAYFQPISNNGQDAYQVVQVK